MDVFTDTDFAGCEVTRRSTSGACVMLGLHCLKHWATTQTTIALSSGEAELNGIARGAAHALGFKRMAMDMGYPLTIDLHSDAVAAN